LSFRNKLQNFLVVRLGISHKEAKELIINGRVSVNGIATIDNLPICELDEVILNEEVLQYPREYRYIKYYKPVGIECSMRLDAADTLGNTLPNNLKGLQVCGRLDKASEGLLLLTDHGKLIQQLTHPLKGIWKTYEVFFESEITDEFIKQFELGIEVGGILTKPTKVKKIGLNQLEIKLQEGRNKQIRRMSFSLNNYVTKLKRLMIGDINLGSLAIGDYAALSDEETRFVRKLLSI
jgi:pseudouridine synthase